MGGVPKNRERADENRDLAGKALAEVSREILGGFVAYENAFGREAAEQLNRLIAGKLDKLVPAVSIKVQRDLF